MIRRLTITWVFNTVALFVAAWLLSGLSYGSDGWALLGAGLAFTLVNFFLKPVLTVLSIPFIIVTLGLFYLLLNVLMLYLTHWIVPAVHHRRILVGGAGSDNRQRRERLPALVLWAPARPRCRHYAAHVSLHPLAERFASVADQYEHGRPEYAPAVVGAMMAELRLSRAAPCSTWRPEPGS